MDQALTLTPGVPEGLRESIVERVEEGSREYVRKATDPRQQALWRQNAQRAGSSAWKVARGGGGTSRASGQIYRDTPTGSTNAETGEFSIIASGEAPTVGGQPGSSTSSVHSFFAGPSINVTTVVTVSFLDGSLGTSLQDSGFAVNQPSHLEQVAPMTAPSNNQNARPSAQAGYAVPRAPGAPPPGDPGFISGREW